MPLLPTGRLATLPEVLRFRLTRGTPRSEEHTSELQSPVHLVHLHSFPTRRSSDLPGSTAWFNWDGQVNGIKVAALSTPTAPSGVTPTGTPGGTTYTYAIVAYGQTGNTPGSATLSTNTGNA